MCVCVCFGVADISYCFANSIWDLETLSFRLPVPEDTERAAEENDKLNQRKLFLFAADKHIGVWKVKLTHMGFSSFPVSIQLWWQWWLCVCACMRARVFTEFKIYFTFLRISEYLLVWVFLMRLLLFENLNMSCVLHIQLWKRFKPLELL